MLEDMKSGDYKVGALAIQSVLATTEGLFSVCVCVLREGGIACQADLTPLLYSLFSFPSSLLLLQALDEELKLNKCSSFELIEQYFLEKISQQVLGSTRGWLLCFQTSRCRGVLIRSNIYSNEISTFSSASKTAYGVLSG